MAGLVLGALWLAGCVVAEPGRYGARRMEVAPAVVVTDDYLYYPGYEIYYSDTRHDYIYREGNAWVRRPAPRGVTVNVLRAAPSVRVDFHDSPANHHAVVAREYPRNWAPPARNQRAQPARPEDNRNKKKDEKKNEKKDDRKDDRHHD